MMSAPPLPGKTTGQARTQSQDKAAVRNRLHKPEFQLVEAEPHSPWHCHVPERRRWLHDPVHAKSEGFAKPADRGLHFLDQGKLRALPVFGVFEWCNYYGH